MCVQCAIWYSRKLLKIIGLIYQHISAANRAPTVNDVVLFCLYRCAHNNQAIKTKDRFGTINHFILLFVLKTFKCYIFVSFLDEYNRPTSRIYDPHQPFYL